MLQMPEHKNRRAVIPDRLTAKLEDGFVLFLIGMRVNRPWKVHKWLPVAMAMPRMLKELSLNANVGMLGYEVWFGRTIVVVEYWRSADKLLAYAKNRDAEHLPAWSAFNKRIGTSGDVGIWHETYVVAPNAFETMYVNMPPFGLGKASGLVPATGRRRRSSLSPSSRGTA
jgi:hypothetical protein